MITREDSDFNKIKVPEILFKYRDWKDEWHKKILTEGEVYLARPDSFKDELDCHIPRRYDLLTTRSIYNTYFEESKKNNPHFSRQQHRKFVRNWTKNTLVKDEKYVNQVENEFWSKFNVQFGVLSLTTDPLNIKMWEEYSINHTGFCIGFDGKELIKFGGGGIVKYYDELPIINPFSFDCFQEIYSKLKKWEFEDEYRVYQCNPKAYNDNWRKVTIDPMAMRKIIIGAKMEENDRKEIISICRKRYPNAEIIQALFKNDVLEFNKVEKFVEYEVC